MLSRLGWVPHPSHPRGESPLEPLSLQQTSFSVFSRCSGGVMIYFDRIEVVNFLIQSAGESRVLPQPHPGGCAAVPGGAEAVPMFAWEPGCPTGVPRARAELGVSPLSPEFGVFIVSCFYHLHYPSPLSFVQQIGVMGCAGRARGCEQRLLCSLGTNAWAAFSQIRWILERGSVGSSVCAAPTQPEAASDPSVHRAGGRYWSKCHKTLAVNKPEGLRARGVPPFTGTELQGFP